ncbi:MAG TPA: AAA family ATPase, partial [Spirochaetia bacterium]|nr:AAA family ATPase [Spirochaetia bacterium]
MDPLDCPIESAPHLPRITVLSVAWGENWPAPHEGDRVRALVEAPVARRGGRVVPSHGPGLQAVWGIDGPREDDAAEAVRAALEVRQALVDADEQALHLGIETGCGMGRAGGPVTGLASHHAATLARAAGAGEVWMGSTTYRLVRGLFELQPKPLGPDDRAYLVVAAKVRVFQQVQRGLADRESPFVGRQTELTLLREAFETVVRTGVRAGVTVCGDPGMGKSRLLRELEDWTDLHPARCWLFRGRCEPPFERSPWALVRDILAVRFGIPENRSGQEAVTALEGGMAHLWTPAKAAEAAPWIAALVGWYPDHGLTTNSQILKDRALGYLEDWWTDLALRHSLLIVLEDLHWADEASLGALQAVFDRIRDRPFLLLANTRPGLWDRQPDWGTGRPWHRRITLPPLTDAEAGSLVSHLVGDPTLAGPGLVGTLVERSGGNPFFAEELVHAWKEAGAGEWKPGRLPFTLGAILDGRLARLSPGARRLAGQAAVLGQTFWNTGVEALEGAVWPQEPWAELAKADLIFRRETSLVAGATEWQFRHALLRQAVLDSAPEGWARQWSRAAAQWFTAQDLADGAARAAPHWEAAGDRDRAAQAYRTALAAARSTRAPGPAVQ